TGENLKYYCLAPSSPSYSEATNSTKLFLPSNTLSASFLKLFCFALRSYSSPVSLSWTSRVQASFLHYLPCCVLLTGIYFARSHSSGPPCAVPSLSSPGALVFILPQCFPGAMEDMECYQFIIPYSIMVVAITIKNVLDIGNQILAIAVAPTNPELADEVPKEGLSTPVSELRRELANLGRITPVERDLMPNEEVGIRKLATNGISPGPSLLLAASTINEHGEGDSIRDKRERIADIHLDLISIEVDLDTHQQIAVYAICDRLLEHDGGSSGYIICNDHYQALLEVTDTKIYRLPVPTVLALHLPDRWALHYPGP
ncbi:hypothetical protein B0H66DRAFT_372224, partial [Apodospora peruviana]